MVEDNITIINKRGLHARAAAKLVTLASKSKSKITIKYNEKEANGKSIMGIMMLAASQGSCLQINVSGADEEKALIQIKELINNRFDEGE
ncbi:HPr family phosphocarrier protein [Candidatus Nitrosacidococcus sp. I8]|uniref:HPr family phosphocarrier protein n=1 Tax=Candidatus Nitrosacidococcus sp. I8 TaxID=2942908 RepID=UPI0022263CEE|nr:HPr family phosphocarrier protein [Candidatus Nitrosacidococcus sp. I8]CAH9019605.1 Phosphocarrier protein HPr [Candidatus Nitrosacidococcus sp. I8]